jgi:uncharacterized CHY-type Zn-finger protein
MNLIHGEEVHGSGVDAQTRCSHYKSDLDVIAIKFKCCGDWFPCYECHAECVSHPAQVWNSDEHDAHAILCGVCGHQLTIAEYLGCDTVCPNCRNNFNPKCADHYDLYFEVSD